MPLLYSKTSAPSSLRFLSPHSAVSRLQVQTGGIYAVTEACRLVRRVFKQMPKMTTAVCAQYLSPLHAEAVVVLELYCSLVGNVKKTWPAAVCIKLGFGIEQNMSTIGADIYTIIACVNILARKWRLSCLIEQNSLLLVAQSRILLLWVHGSIVPLATDVLPKPALSASDIEPYALGLSSLSSFRPLTTKYTTAATIKKLIT